MVLNQILFNNYTCTWFIELMLWSGVFHSKRRRIHGQKSSKSIDISCASRIVLQTCYKGKILTEALTTPIFLVQWRMLDPGVTSPTIKLEVVSGSFCQKAVEMDCKYWKDDCFGRRQTKLWCGIQAMAEQGTAAIDFKTCRNPLASMMVEVGDRYVNGQLVLLI